MYNKISNFKPKYSIVCLIYKSVEWLDFVYKQVIKYSNLDDTEFFFIANDANQEVLNYLRDNYIPHYEFNTSTEQKKEWYINNVYRGYNYGAKKAKGEFLIFINSDMAFSPNWIKNLSSKYNGHNCISSRLIESGKMHSGKYGLEKNFGEVFFEYKENEFIDYIETFKEDGVIKEGGLYMPLFIKKSDFLMVGGYSEGNIVKGSDPFNPQIAIKGDNMQFGDVALIEKLKTKGISHITAFDSIIYHFQAGEISYNKLKNKSNKINICIYNDLLNGTMNEKVLWNYLLEKLPGNIFGIDKIIIGKNNIFENQANNYLKENYKDTDIIIQNASFIGKMDNDIATISYLQDNLRRMGKKSPIQENNLIESDLIVTNSIDTTESYKEFNTEILPIGVDTEIFNIKNKLELKNKYNIPNGNIAIFVGSLSETKGWDHIRELLEKNNKIDHYIIVSKYNEEYTSKKCSFFKQLNQNTLSELLNCADFFILGSKVETQCLAAIEAALCDLPIIMRNIGFFKDLKEKDRKHIGEFGEDLSKSIEKVLVNINKYSPRKTMLEQGIDLDSMIEKWIKIIERFILITKQKKYSKVKKIKKKKNFLYIIEINIRKKILRKIGLENITLKMFLDKNAYKYLIRKILGK